MRLGDKPDFSFIDFTTMILMQDLGITEIFTGDAHFRQGVLVGSATGHHTETNVSAAGSQS